MYHHIIGLYGMHSRGAQNLVESKGLLKRGEKTLFLKKD